VLRDEYIVSQHAWHLAECLPRWQDVSMTFAHVFLWHASPFYRQMQNVVDLTQWDLHSSSSLGSFLRLFTLLGATLRDLAKAITVLLVLTTPSCCRVVRSNCDLIFVQGWSAALIVRQVVDMNFSVTFIRSLAASHNADFDRV
jgi:hypothetical protein